MQETWVSPRVREEPTRYPYASVMESVLQILAAASVYIYTHIYGTSKALLVKNLLADTEDMRHRLDPWVGKIPWRRAWQPSPVF